MTDRNIKVATQAFGCSRQNFKWEKVQMPCLLGILCPMIVDGRKGGKMTLDGKWSGLDGDVLSDYTVDHGTDKCTHKLVHNDSYNIRGNFCKIKNAKLFEIS